jgi:predicted ATP-dependent protease
LQSDITFANNKIKVMLAIGLAASLAFSLVIYFNSAQKIDTLTAEVSEKSKALEARHQQITEYTSAIAAQKQQIDEKNIQLESLSSEIGMLENQVALNELELASKSLESKELTKTIDVQKSEIQILKGQVTNLRDEIQDLENQVTEKENEIAALTGEVQETRDQLESSKRVKVSHYSVAVTQNDVGIVLPIEVEIIPSGEGLVSIDVSNVEYETGFQDAVRTAVTVASEYSDVSTSNKDVIIRVVNDFNGNGLITLDGGSAGALIAGMVAAGLMDRDIDSSVLITGTIEQDGTVGRIGGLDEKADAASDFGADTMLVPDDQEFDHDSINIIGVSDIDDVMGYLT